MALTELDRHLLERCLTQESGAWRDFIDRFVGLFLHVIQHTAHSRSVEFSGEDIDDLCSEILVGILQDDLAVLRQFRGDSSLATYLAVIARRIVVREMARRKMSEAMGHVKAHQGAVEQALYDTGRIDNRELVEHMLLGLPAVEASVLRQFHLEGKTYHEISQGLKIPENSIGPLLTRAREKLRRAGMATL